VSARARPCPPTPYLIAALTSVAAIIVFVYFTEQGKQPTMFLGISVATPDAVGCLYSPNTQ